MEGKENRRDKEMVQEQRTGLTFSLSLFKTWHNIDLSIKWMMHTRSYLDTVMVAQLLLVITELKQNFTLGPCISQFYWLLIAQSCPQAFWVFLGTHATPEINLNNSIENNNFIFLIYNTQNVYFCWKLPGNICQSWSLPEK